MQQKTHGRQTVGLSVFLAWRSISPALFMEAVAPASSLWLEKSGKKPVQPQSLTRIIHKPFVVAAFMRPPALSATSDPMNRATTSVHE